MCVNLVHTFKRNFNFFIFYTWFTKKIVFEWYDQQTPYEVMLMQFWDWHFFIYMMHKIFWDDNLSNPILYKLPCFLKANNCLITTLCYVLFFVKNNIIYNLTQLSYVKLIMLFIERPSFIPIWPTPIMISFYFALNLIVPPFLPFKSREINIYLLSCVTSIRCLGSMSSVYLLLLRTCAREIIFYFGTQMNLGTFMLVSLCSCFLGMPLSDAIYNAWFTF